MAGNSGACHCAHVDDLLKRVSKLEADPYPDFWKPGEKRPSPGDAPKRGSTD